MSSLGEINRKIYKIDSVLDNSSTYPVDVTGKNIVGVSISNNDALNSALITLETEQGSTIPIRVAPGKNFDTLSDKLVSVNSTGGATTFDVALFKEG